VDSRLKWFEDRVSVIATGATIPRRRLYTDDELIDMPINTWLVLTSHTPPYKRHDVVERLILMKMRELGKSRTSENVIISQVLENRDRLMTEVIYMLQEVVTALKTSAGIVEQSAFRMADFWDFSVKVARYAGIEAEVKEIFYAMAAEQQSMAIEDDSIVLLLAEWVKTNSGRKITSTDLCVELESVAEHKKITFRFRGNPMGFSRNLGNVKANLAEHFNIISQKGPHNTNLISFSPKTGESYLGA
jgi:hypothetical protein